MSLVGRIATQPPPALDPGLVPAPLMSVLADALAKTPEERIPTADALRDRLESARLAMDGTPLAATTATAVVGPATVVAPVLESHTTEVPVAPAAVAYRSAAPAPRRSRGNGVLGVLIVLILLAVVAVAIAAAMARDDDTPPASTTASSAPETTAASTTSTTAASTTTTTAPSTTSTTAAAPGGAGVGAIDDAAADYFAAIGGGDLGEAYGMLSADFQDAQSREDFDAFWGSFDSVRVSGPIEVDEGARTATVPLELDGSSETMTLSFVEEDGDWRIDGPRPAA